MTRKALLNTTIKRMEKLPDQKLQEISDYVEFLLKKADDSFLTKEIGELNSESFDFLDDEEELYTVEDVKEVYNEKV